MNPVKQHRKLLDLQERAQLTTERKKVKKILKKYKKVITKIESASKDQ